MDEPISVVNGLNTKSSKLLKVVLHGLERFGGVPLPIRDLTRNPQRLPGAVGLGRITRIFRVRQIGVIHNRAGRFHYVCLLYTSPSPRDGLLSRMPSSA